MTTWILAFAALATPAQATPAPQKARTVAVATVEIVQLERVEFDKAPQRTEHQPSRQRNVTPTEIRIDFY